MTLAAVLGGSILLVVKHTQFFTVLAFPVSGVNVPYVAVAVRNMTTNRLSNSVDSSSNAGGPPSVALARPTSIGLQNRLIGRRIRSSSRFCSSFWMVSCHECRPFCAANTQPRAEAATYFSLLRRGGPYRLRSAAGIKNSR